LPARRAVALAFLFLERRATPASRRFALAPAAR
jgi:hypothetical protein